MAAASPSICHCDTVANNGKLPPELMRKAEQELQEREQWRHRDIGALRELVSEDGKLKSRLDDDFLLRFLRARKFDYELSLEMIQQYYWTRAQNGALFARLLPSTLEPAFRRRLQTVLPSRDHNGCRIFVFRPGAWDPASCSMDDIFLSNVLCLESVAREQATQVNGVVAIQDFRGFGLNQVRHFRPEDIRRMISILQGSFPLRFKGFHFVFEPKMFYWAFAAVKPFLNKKLSDRLYFHGDRLESLHEHFSPSCLPQELGGSGPSYETSCEHLLQQLRRSEAYFAEQRQYGYQQGV